ncbi:hypothetical protein LOTGIDRAFT_233981 [Lottia gigantea]|uniref:BEACH domain-containing protein n=1 Tax=Lottia gigantea TaxID=225164 RepID=V4A0J2_LOTGI|nr:hypothetical protein LOTGIDRAFT_233981 [Lottia gigantea]ESO90187.1 hypothetical protein LOTGIDRAFT_233981 [Lottia gigantea]
MESVTAISDRLSIPKHHSRCLSKTRVVCIVHNDWYKNLRQGKLIQIPPTDHFTNLEAERLLAGSSLTLPETWLRLTIKVVQKQNVLVERLRDDNLYNTNVADNIFGHLNYVAHENFNTQWRNAFHLYKGSKKSAQIKEYVKFNSSVHQYIDKFKPEIIINLDTTVSTLPLSTKKHSELHPNLVPCKVLIETETHFFFIQPYIPYTLHNLVFYSPSVLTTSPANTLFILYQLLHSMQCLHQHGLSAKGINLCNILIDKNLWISVTTPQIKTWIKEKPGGKEEIEPHKDQDHTAQVPKTVLRLTSEKEDLVTSAQDYLTSYIYKQYSISDLPTIVDNWVHKKLTNFQYLMILNHLAGRVMNDPNNHPVLPWVMDFTGHDSGYRDLTMSKYRINKGDYQLDFTYNSMIGLNENGEHIPHHVSDVLSDITYFVYKARRTEKSILCTHVRTNWVPHEYPSSMQRMMEWTPDECIPEFYTDPNIFVSIHEDLPDLEIPLWCSSTYDFITRHMAALESEAVSEMLHYWIDLTFGYKLSGSAAVKSKNVYLQLVDNHKTITNHGVVQLFTQPHPHRPSSTQPFTSVLPPKIYREVLPAQMMQLHQTSGSQETVVHALRSMEVVDFIDKTRPEDFAIQLPNNYTNILQALDDYESQLNFSTKVLQHKLSTDDRKRSKYPEDEVRDIITEDLTVFICNMCEIFLSPKLRALGCNVPLLERYRLIQSLCSTECIDLPRTYRKAASFLLSTVIIDESDHEKPKLQYLTDNDDSIPLPTPSYLLQPFTNILPFPDYFDKLYSCLAELKQKDDEIEKIHWSMLTLAEKNSLIKSLQREKVPLLDKFLQKHHKKLGKQGLNILSPYIEELFENEITTVQAAWCFLNTMSRELGREETTKRLMPHLIKLFSGEHSTAKHVKLYHRQFLMQLIVRLGLKTFIVHFATLLVEAVSGFKDFYVPSKFYNEELLEDPSPAWDTNMSRNRSLNELSIGQPNEFTFQNDYEETTHIDGDDNEDEFITDNMSMEDEDETRPMSGDSTSIGKQSTSSDISDIVISTQDDEGDDTPPIFGSVASVHSIAHLLEEQSRQKLLSIEEGDTGSVSQNLTPSQSERQSGAESQDEDDEPKPSSQFYLSVEETEAIWHTSRKESMVRSETEDLMMNISTSSPKDILNIRDVAMESVKWLCHKLGPVLTAKHLSRNLIRMISLCYIGDEQLQNLEKSDNPDLKSSRLVIGDEHCIKILDCLGFVAQLYGEQVILLQYIPCIVDLVSVCQKRLTPRSETGILGALLLLRHVLQFLTDKSVMDILKQMIVIETLMPIIKLVTSPNTSFPGGSLIRTVICHKIIDVLYILGLRLGFQMTRLHLNQAMQIFFDAFNCVHGKHLLTSLNSKMESTSPSAFGSQGSEEGYLPIKMDSNTKEYKIGSPISVKSIHMPAQRPKLDQTPKYHSLSSMNLLDEKDELNEVKVEDKNKDNGLMELAEVFTPELALAAYIPMCRIFGSIHMEKHLRCDDLIRNLCAQQDKSMDNPQFQQSQNSSEYERDLLLSKENDNEVIKRDVRGGIGQNVAVIGNRIELTESIDTSTSTITEFGRSYKHSGILSINPDRLCSEDMDNYKGRHLKGNWLAYWEHELGLHERDTSFNFKQIKLQTFTGHTNSIRSLFVMDSENSFISASKDKTVKLWSLSSLGDGNGKCSCVYNYQHHKKSVFSVAYVETARLVASCDSTVHIWDPFTGSTIKQLESSKYAPVVAVAPIPSPSTMIVTATTDATLRFLDLRTAKYEHEFRCSTASAGLIRCVAVSPDGKWIAVGFSTGMIILLDLLSGILMAAWKAHDGEILQIKAFDKSRLVSTSFDQTVKVWKVEDGKELCNLKGPTEPVHCICFYRNQVLSATTANRIGLHTTIEENSSFSSTKLTSDTFKGVLTCMSVLPLNRALLVGADNGSIRLLC